MGLIKYISLLVYLCFWFFTTAAGKVTDEELHSFPKLFHLDDFYRCLSKRDGVYCLGTFELTADQPHTILDLMKQHTKERYTYNRTLLRRGYCLSERCQHTLPEANTTLRFESCVAKHIQRYSLTPHLKRLHYCTSYHQREEEKSRGLNREQTWFLFGIGVVLMLNLVGTIYHCYKKDDSNLNAFLLAWSVSQNWSRFTKLEHGGMLAALAPLQAARIFMQWIVIFAHAMVSHYKVYVQNAEYLEELPARFLGVLIGNGTVMVQNFIVISCFLTGFSLLYSAQKIKFNAKTLFLWVLKRLTRVLPVYLLVLGFVITYWPHAGDGPLWPSVVGEESAVCRRKFWTQILFINNLVMLDSFCMLQTWAVSVDMQLYILSTAITLLLMKLKVRAVPILAFLFVAAVVVNVTLAYVNGWDPIVRLVNAETVRNVFRYTPSFAKVHQSPWGSMSACLFGLFIAHYYYEKTSGQNKNNIDGSNETQNGRTGNVLDKTNAPMGENSQQNGYTYSNEDKKQTESNISSDLDVNNGVSSNGPIRNGGNTGIQSVGNETRKRKGWVTNENIETNKNEENCSIDVKQNELSGNGVGETQSGESVIYRDDETDGSNMKELPNARINKRTGNRRRTSILQNLFIRYGHILTVPMLVLWVQAAASVINVESQAVTALYVGAERTIFVLLSSLLLLHLLTVDSSWRRLFAWKGWQAMGRLAYCVFLLHWCVNASIVAARSEVISTSAFYIFVDALATLFFTYMLAIPVHLLLELPAQKFLDLLMSVPITTQYRQ